MYTVLFHVLCSVILCSIIILIDAHPRPALNGLPIDATSKPPATLKGKGSIGTNSHISTPTSPLSNVQSPFAGPGGTPVLGGGAGTASSSPEEPTLETLGVKIGDKVVIDTGTAKSKVGKRETVKVQCA